MGTSETLRAVIDAGRAAKRLDELSTARVIGKVAEQIHLAQQRAGTGKAIGPITPAGIIIDSKGITKLGLAEPTAYAYASPEQVGGREGDRRSDVFSLGIIMWEALTHRPLFEAGSDAATKAAVAEQAIVAPSELNANVPAELGTICMKALARNSADRYQSAKVMAAEIEAVLDDAGYGNSDDKIAAYIANIGRDNAAAKPRTGSATSGKLATSVATAALPPPRRAGLTGAPIVTNPPMIGGTPVSPLPSVLGRPGPPASTPTLTTVPGTPVGPSVAAPAAVPATAPGTPVGPSVAAPATVPATAPGTPVGPLTPAPATVPDAPRVPSTTPGFAGAPGMTPVPADPPPPAPTPAATLIGGPPGPTPAPPPAPLPPPPDMPRPSQFPTARGPTKLDPHAVTLPDLESRGTAPSPDAQAPSPQSAVTARAPTAPPHPAGAVSLASKGRETELLGNWGWGTGAHPKVDDHDDLADEPPARNPMPYIIGGGLAVAGVIVAVALLLGDRKQAKPEANPPPAAATGSNRDPHSVNAASSAAPSDARAEKLDAGRTGVVDTESNSAGTIGAAPTPHVTKQLETLDHPGDARALDSAVADSGVAGHVVAAAPPDAQPAKPTPPIRTPVASTNDKPKTAKPVRANPSVGQNPRPDPRPNTRVPNTASTNKKDAELPYRQGLQAFMRGDTSGALTSLRASLAANPNYAPAWRALGLVFEKMGDKDQARRALRRYLQLAPGANDADQIRNRLERLGP